jgi:hypothetical protein
MEFPIMQEVTRYREMTNAFGGYNHRLSCEEGEFFDMKNMTSQYFPILSPRNKRCISTDASAPVEMISKNGVMWLADDTPTRLEYIVKNGDTYERKTQYLEGVEINPYESTMVAMGAYVVILPANVWINTSKEPFEYGYMGAKFDKTKTSAETQTVKISLANARGEVIEYESENYYKTHAPSNGDYMLSSVNGKVVLKEYSSATSVWNTVTTTYVQIESTFIGVDFEKGDGVTISIKDIDNVPSIFVNEEDGRHSLNAVIVAKKQNAITVAGIIGESVTLTDADLVVERKIPEMSFVTECGNRLWGCSKDGHEIYCCKLGDVKNWYVYAGLSTDSWAVTIGSDGKFTGAITYQGMPMFFKEDCFIKISVSSTGAHQLKETKCRGVQEGSHKSLTIVNETLFYKSPSGVVATNGALPSSVSDALGEVRYYDAVGGSIGDRYYISMRDKDGSYCLFVFNQKTGIWTKEDDAQIRCFCNFKDDLFFVVKRDGAYRVESVNGTLFHDSFENEVEKNINWYAESGNIGYSSPDNKYVARINLRITLEFGTNVDFYLQYNSDGNWEHKFNMSGKGTRTFTVPIIPKRCDHFKYKIVGKGGCKIHSITKTVEQGSDI